jgi:aryl-phospho-beta-D-glucosidase BglC (GH1 family)
VAGVLALTGFQSNLRPGVYLGKTNASIIPGPHFLQSSKLGPIATQGTRTPIIQGWGGITASEVVSTNLVQRLNQSGYNAIRVSFGTAPGFPCLNGELGSWDPNLFTQVLQTTQVYNMTVILDYHGYNNPNDITFQPCWLSFWTGVILQFKNQNGVIWEPVNEPAGNQTALSLGYQAFINMARSLGDVHWVAVENTISNDGCAFDPLSLANCYPTVVDPLNQTFLSIHPYFFYDQWLKGGYGNCASATSIWSNSTAECAADIYNQGMLQASASYHMPILDTEGGAVYYSCNNVCANPPDAVGTDDASYSTTTFHFIQYLTNRMQSENIGWLWWEAGEGSCCGALDTWGSFLKFQPIISPPHDQPPTLQAPSGVSAVAGHLLSFKVNASDSDTPPQDLSLTCLDCPAGASFPGVSGPGQVTGVFAWTPSNLQAGQSYNITFRASDGVQSSNATIGVNVYLPNKPPTNLPPVLIIPGSQGVTVAETLSFGVNATDLNTPAEILSLTCTNCGTLGATFIVTLGTSGVIGRMSWTSSNSRTAGNYIVEFTATNGLNSSVATVHITVTKAKVVLIAAVHPTTLNLGLSESASETVSLTNGFNPSGNITVTAYLNNDICTGGPSFISIMPVNGNGYYSSQPFTPQDPGIYQWEASYSGDIDNAASVSTCGSTARTLTVSQSGPPSQPQPQPPCLSCHLPNGSLTIDSPIVWITAVGTAGLAMTAAVMVYRKRIKKI